MDIPFEDFFSRVCAKMDLDPQYAQLGYKYHTDKARDNPHQLSNEEQLYAAMYTGAGLMQHARTRKIVLYIHNLAPLREAPAAVRLRKCKEQGDENDTEIHPDLKTTLSFTRKLKGRLSCVKHPGRWCYLSPVNGEHIFLDIYKMTLWAKQIFLGDASYENPPAALAFDHLPVKRRRVGPSSSQAASAPTNVQVVISNHLPLGDQLGQWRFNTSTLSTSTSSVSTPTTTIDLSGDSSDDLDAPPDQVRLLLSDVSMAFPDSDVGQYHNELINIGISDIVQFLDADEALLALTNIPADLIPILRDHTEVLVRCWKKGKAVVRN